jgi:hypothetical protein
MFPFSVRGKFCSRAEGGKAEKSRKIELKSLKPFTTMQRDAGKETSFPSPKSPLNPASHVGLSRAPPPLDE